MHEFFVCLTGAEGRMWVKSERLSSLLGLLFFLFFFFLALV